MRIAQPGVRPIAAHGEPARLATLPQPVGAVQNGLAAHKTVWPEIVRVSNRFRRAIEIALSGIQNLAAKIIGYYRFKASTGFRAVEPIGAG